MTAPVWCQSGTVPVAAGRYRLADGSTARVRQSRAGKFYAVLVVGRTCEYHPGLIHRLSAELDAETAVKLP